MSKILTEKGCTKCNTVKPISEFSIRKDSKIGYTSHCKVCLSEAQKKYVERARVYKKNWKLRNKEKYRASERIRAKKKRQNDPVHATVVCLRNRIKDALKLYKKSKSSAEYLGCDLDFLRKHLESQFTEGMTWENRGYYGWHIDHIIPISSFDLSKESDLKKAFHYSNLQPLWWRDNLKKGAKLPEGKNE
jgi:hypothetical protein